MLKRLNVLVLVVLIVSQTLIGPIGSSAGFISAAEEDGIDGQGGENASGEVTKDTLEEALKDAEKYAAEDYEADSYAAFVDAVNAGEKVAEDADATQEDVNIAVDAVKQAVSALQQKTSTEEDGEAEADSEGEESTEPEDEETEGDDQKSSTNSNQISITAMNVQPAEIDVKLAKFNITINGKSIEDAKNTELEQDANVAGSFVFNANLEADGANLEGAWFTFELPDTILDFGNSFTGSKPATDDTPAFKYSVTGQTVKVELTEDVDPTIVSNAVEFVLNFNAKFDLDGNDLEQELEIPKTDGTSGTDKIKLNFKPGTSNQKVVQKKSNGVKTENGERYIEWEIWVNKNGQNLNNAKLEDTPSGSIHKIVDGSVNVIEYPVGLNGPDESNGTAKVTNGDFSDLTMNGKNAYKVTYKTKAAIADKEGNYYSGQQYYSNNAVVKEGDQTIDSGNGQAWITFGKALEKKLKSGDSYKATWEIIYNYNLAPIDEDKAVITDTVTGAHVLNPESIKVYEVTVNDSGQYESETEAASGSYSVVQSSEGGFEIQFKADTDGKVTKAYRVEYDTVYKNDDHPNFVVGVGEVKNTVDSGAHESVEGTHSIGEGILTKGHTVNFDSKEITWTITIKNTGTSNMANVVVTDDFTDKGEHTLVGDKNDITVNGMTGYTTTVDEDPTKGFTITGGTIAKGETATITYKTKFAINADGSVNTEGYKNIAKVDWKDSDDKEYSLEKDSTYVPKRATANNGIKKGSFNYDTQEFTWQVQVNTNKQSIAGAVLTDKLGEGHELKGKNASSFTVKETTLGGSDENDTGGTELDKGLYDIVVAEDGKSFTLTFANELGDADKKVYLVTYNTVDSDDILGIGSDNAGDAGNTYTNDAKFKTIGEKEFDIPSNDVIVNHANKLIGKSANPDWGEGTYTWTLNVNHSHSNLGNVTVKDTPSENLMLLPGSIEYVYKTQNSSNGNLTNDGNWKSVEENDDFTLTYTDDGGFELDLGDMSNKAVDIRYKTLVLGKENDEFSNEASIEYGSDVETSENQKTDRPVSGNLAFSSSDASASVSKGSIKINKVGYNEATGVTKPLNKVKFQLIKTIGGKDYIIKEGTTDDNGELTFENISYGTFKLVEETPDGYKPLTGYESFVVNADNDYTVVGNENAVVNIVNEEDIKEEDMCPKFTITVENVEGKPDANKKIKLVNETTGEEFEVETNDDGKIIKDRADLPAGKYKVYEKGEKSNTEDDIYIGEITVNYEMKNQEDCADEVRPEVTSVSGTKTWKDGGLNNAERPQITIQLLADGEKTDKTVTLTEDNASSNDDNVWEYEFKNLRKLNNAGTEDIKYTVKEQAVVGYKTEQEGTDFTNTRTSDEKIEIPVVKVWEGPEVEKQAVTINLLADGEDKAELELSESNDWKGTFENLAIYDDDGEEIKYTVEEVKVDGYNTEVTGDAGNGFTITNTQKTYAIGDYVWIDKNKDGKQDENEKVLEDVKVELIDKDGKVIKTTKTDKDGLYIFDELVSGDYQVKFTLTEEQAKKYRFTQQNTGDDTTVDSDADPETGLTKVINLNDDNDYLTKDYDAQTVNATEGIDPTWDAGVIELTDITVTKKWEEKEGSTPPTEITIDLKADGEKVSEHTIKASDGWTLIITGLDRYNTKGEAIEFTVSEHTVSEYNSDVNGLEITNTRKTYAIGDYVWIDRNKDGIQDENEEVLEGVIVELYDENREKVAETTTDEKGRYIFDEIVSGDYQVKFTLTEEQAKKYKFTKQNAGDDTTVDSDADENGWTTDISLNEKNAQLTKDYDSQEVKATEGIDPTWDAGVIELVDVTGTKTWDHKGATDLPKSITVQLLANGEEVDTQTVTTDTDWTYSFTGLDQFDENGKEITYTVDEAEIVEYNKSIEDHDITNTRKTYAIGDYVWIDRNKDGIQDENEEVLEGVIVELYDENGEKVAETTTDENGRYIFDELVSGDYQVKFTLTEEQAKKYKFTKQNAGDDTTVDSDADENGWTTNISLNEENAQLTKDYDFQEVKATEGIDPTWDAGVMELVDMTGTKTWVNNHNKSEALPKSITVNLLANGEEVNSVEVTAKDDWTYSFTGLDKYDEDGIEITYSVTENAVDGYKTSYDGNNITNTKLCEKFTVEVEDKEGKPVTEEEYTFESEDGKKITKKTDKNGKITFDRDELPEGKYTVTNKAGKKVGEIDVEYNVDCEDNVRKVIVPVEKPEAPKTCESVEITVTVDGKPSKDKEYTFTSKDGKTKVTVTTDKDGKVTIDRDKLPNGTYTVTDKDGNVVGTVEITDDCKIGLNIVPKQQSVNPEKPSTEKAKDDNKDKGIAGFLPNTATSIFTISLLGGALLLLGLIALVVRRKKTA